MASADEITCPMCGFKNPADQERCQSCGARVEELRVSYTEEEAFKRRYQQEDFEWTWAALAAGVAAGLQAVVLGLLPRLIYSFDPQGLPGLMLSVPVFFVAGIVLGLVSPGKTFVEPAAGAMPADLIEVDFAGFGPINDYTWTTSLFLHRAFAPVQLGDRLPTPAIGSSRQSADDDA